MPHHLRRPIKVGHRNPKPLPDEFLNRLLQFYHRQPNPPVSPIWEGVLRVYQGPLIRALELGDLPLLRFELETLYVGEVMNGLDGYVIESNFLLQFEWSAIAMANMLGSVPLFAERQPFPLELDVDNLIVGAEGVLGFELNHPGGGGMMGVEVGPRFIPFKLLDVVNVILALPSRDWVSQSILEIGSGSAFLAYLAAVMAGWDLQGYDSIDLPSTSVIGAYLCAGIFGCDSVWLAGEPVDSIRPIRFLGANTAHTLTYGLVVNQDSLPEIPREVAMDYVKMIGKKLLPGGYFLSVNHESPLGGQHRVFDMVKGQTDLKQISRSLFFSRPGYLQEVWVKA